MPIRRRGSAVAASALPAIACSIAASSSRQGLPGGLTRLPVVPELVLERRADKVGDTGATIDFVPASTQILSELFAFLRCRLRTQPVLVGSPE